MLEQAFNYVEGVIGGSGAANASETSGAGDETSYSCKVMPYGPWTFWFSGWLVQFTVHAYVVMYVLSMGGDKPRLGKINAACVMLVYGLFNGGSTLQISKNNLFVNGVAAVPEIPLSRITGLDVKAGWITNLLTVHFKNSAGKAAKLTFWVLDPQQLAHEFQAACAGAKGRS